MIAGITEIGKQEMKDALRRAELRKAIAEADAAEADAVVKHISRLETERHEEEYLAGDQFLGRFSFVSDVNDGSAVGLANRLNNWGRRHPGAPITLVLYSPGGFVTSGLYLFDELRSLKAAGHHLTIVVRGFAASMGAVLLQAADHRVIGADAQVMIHEVAAGAIGKISEMEDEAKRLRRMNDRLFEILAERSSKTARQLRAMSDRKDAWLSADEAVKIGLADAIG